KRAHVQRLGGALRTAKRLQRIYFRQRTTSSRDCEPVAVALWATQTRVCLMSRRCASHLPSRRYGAAGSEAATAHSFPAAHSQLAGVNGTRRGELARIKME